MIYYLCRKGDVLFRSDNMSTVSVLREVISKETARKKVPVRITHGGCGFQYLPRPLCVCVCVCRVE